GRSTAAPLRWDRGQAGALWAALFPRIERVVICPAEPRGQLLQAAHLAGVLKAPLFITHDLEDDAEFCRCIIDWHPTDVYAIGSDHQACHQLPGVHVPALANESSVASACRKRLRGRPVRTLVVANPDDLYEDRGGMSALAPWLALCHDAPLLLTSSTGDDVET